MQRFSPKRSNAASIFYIYMITKNLLKESKIKLYFLIIYIKVKTQIKNFRGGGRKKVEFFPSALDMPMQVFALYVFS